MLQFKFLKHVLFGVAVAVGFGLGIYFSFDAGSSAQRRLASLPMPSKQIFNSASTQDGVSKTSKMLRAVVATVEAIEITRAPTDQVEVITTRTRLRARVYQNSFQTPRSFSYRWRFETGYPNSERPVAALVQGALSGSIDLRNRANPNSLSEEEFEILIDGLNYQPLSEGIEPQLVFLDVNFYNETGSEVHSTTAVFSTHPMNRNLELEPHPLAQNLGSE